MLKKLINLIEYLPSIGENIHIVANEQQGTTVLDSAAHQGRQIVAVLPLVTLEGDSDSMRGSNTPIVFVIEKAPTVAATPDVERGQYIECARALEQILEQITRDMTTGRDGTPCPLLAGLDLAGVQIAPEAGVFGGWNGYSATITLR